MKMKTMKITDWIKNGVLATIIMLCILHYMTNNKLIDKQVESIKNLQEQNRVLVDEQLELLDNIALMGEEIDRLTEENQIFGSMLGQIEFEEGGHEILEKLYKHNKVWYEQQK
jgi:hypothetical protein